MLACFNKMARGLTVLLLFISLTRAEPGLRTCEPIRVEMCMGLGYNKTGMPNYGDHERQSDAVITLRTFQPLIEYGCSAQLKFFLCSVFIPMCTDKVAQPIGPCRGLCEKVRSRCYPVLQGFGFPWPMALNCSRFPSENNHEHMCMEGPSEMSTDFTSAVHKYHMTPQGPTPCSKLTKPNQYLYVKSSGGCVPYCGSDILFDSSDKSFAEVWLSIWAAMCFVSTIVALLSFAIDADTWRRYPENSLVFLTLCYALVSVGWSIRSAAGRSAVACRADETGARLLMLTEDGLGNANCAVVFILLYYFGMAASVWWVVVCGSWTAVAGLRWSQERLQGASSLLHVVAWGVPAAHTLTVLVRREVVADELTGICYAGTTNPHTLLWLVLVPHTACLVVGVALLITGAVLLSRRRPPGPPLPAAGAAANTLNGTPVVKAIGTLRRGKQKIELMKVGMFALLNTIPLGCLVGTYAYEYWGRPSWLADTSKPALWVFLLRIFMSLVVGITSCIWIWNPHTVSSWRNFLSRLLPHGYHQPPVKAHPLPVLRYVPANHNAAHTQPLVPTSQSALTVGPGSVVGSVSMVGSMAGMGSMGRGGIGGEMSSGRHSRKHRRSSRVRTGSETIL